jgi:hypothetical protein
LGWLRRCGALETPHPALDVRVFDAPRGLDLATGDPCVQVISPNRSVACSAVGNKLTIANCVAHDANGGSSKPRRFMDGHQGVVAGVMLLSCLPRKAG